MELNRYAESEISDTIAGMDTDNDVTDLNTNTTETDPPIEDEPITPIDPVPDPEPDPGTPTSYTVYYGSLMKTVDLTADEIQSLDSVTDSKSFSATFKQGYNRFAVAFPTAYASSLSVNDDTPIFGGDITSYFAMSGSVTLNGISYKVYKWDIAANESNTPLTINLT